MINIKDAKRKLLNSLDEEKIERVLDLGCSKGYMSKKFAVKGADVTGVDKKAQDIDFANYDFSQMDIEDFSFENYDLVIASLVLHYLDKDNAVEIIRKIQGATLDGGYNLIVCMSEDDSLAEKKRFYPSLDKLNDIYLDWDIQEIFQGTSEEESHGNQGEHKHHLIFLLARKEHLEDA